MRALIIVESCFGSTRTLAEQIGAGLREKGAQVEILSPDQAPAKVPERTTLLILGAPTHNRGLPSPASRASARAKGGTPGRTGVREWLTAATLPAGLEVAAFDTVTGRGWLNGSAARRAARLASRRGTSLGVRTRSFLVAQDGPASSEAGRARAWGAELAGS